VTLEACVLSDADRLDSLGASVVMRWAMTMKRGRWPETRTYHPDDPFALWREPDGQRYLLALMVVKDKRSSSTRSQDTQVIRTHLRGGTRRDRIELPRNVIRVIEADVLAMGHWIFFNPIVAYPCRV
jgi:hypothetical protein